jgi:hypothetical protein
MQRGARRAGRLAAGVCLLLAVMVPGALAQSSRSGNVTATFVVNPQARLTLSSNALTFPSADPDTVTQIPALEGPLAVTIGMRSAAGTTVVLTAQASDDLRSGMASIAISALTWTASGPGFTGGTMSKSAQTVGSWAAAGTSTGALTFWFHNSWAYSAGHYSTTITCTLTVP